MNPVSHKNRRLGIVLLVLGLFLILNSAYIAAFGNPNIFYVANGLLHPFLGVLVAILFVVYARRHRELFTGAWSKSALTIIVIPARLF